MDCKMKLKYILGVIFLLLAMLTACDDTVQSDNKLKMAPFGLQWEMHINDFKSQNSNDFNIEDDRNACPLVILETKNLNKGLGNKEQIYKLLFLPENNRIKINGLIGVEYLFSTENKDLFNVVKESIFENLNEKYGNTTYDNEKHNYKYEDEYSQINLAIDETDKKSYIFLFIYYKPMINPNMDAIFKEITLDCKKERNPL